MGGHGLPPRAPAEESVSLMSGEPEWRPARGAGGGGAAQLWLLQAARVGEVVVPPPASSSSTPAL